MRPSPKPAPRSSPNPAPKTSPAPGLVRDTHKEFAGSEHEKICQDGLGAKPIPKIMMTEQNDEEAAQVFPAASGDSTDRSGDCITEAILTKQAVAYQSAFWILAG